MTNVLRKNFDTESFQPINDFDLRFESLSTQLIELYMYI